MRIPPTSIGFVLLLSGIAALPPVSIDMCLPALTTIGRDLSAPATQTGQTLSLFLIGYALSQLVFGPFADRFGRRPALLIGCVLFVVAALGTATAASIGALLAWRVVQGVGAGAGSVMAIAIVRDLFEGAVARAKLSYVNAVMNAAPLVGPTLGSLVLTAAGWRPLFALQAGVGLVLLIAIALGFAESLPPARARALSPRRLLAGYARVLRHRVALGYVLVASLTFASLFSYVAGSPFVFIPLLGPRLYGLSFAATACGTVLGSLLSGRRAGRGIGVARLLPIGLAVVVLMHAALLLLALTDRFSVAAALPLLILGMVAIGFVLPNAVHGALEPFPDMAGVASALRGSLQMTAGACASGLVALLYRGTPVAMALVMAVCSAGALVTWAALLRPARALQPAPYG